MKTGEWHGLGHQVTGVTSVGEGARGGAGNWRGRHRKSQGDPNSDWKKGDETTTAWDASGHRLGPNPLESRVAPSQPAGGAHFYQVCHSCASTCAGDALGIMSVSVR